MKLINKDIIIVGGGLAGVCAGIAAARNGKSVAIITNRPVLGGNSSSEIRVWTRGSAGAGNLFGEEMGILGELKLYNEYLNPKGNPVLWDEVVLDTVLQEENIELFLNTFITTVDMENSEIVKSVSGYEIVSENKYVFSSTMFIDATGDGFLGMSAKVPYVMGKEDRTVYDEKRAPSTFHKTTQGNTILFYTKKSNDKVPYIAPKFAYSLEFIDKLLNNGGRIVNEETSGCDLWWVEYGGQMNTIEDFAKINIEDKKLIHGIFNYIKNSGKFDADNLVLEWVGNIAGKRESRRFVTDYVLNCNDILENKKFEDVGLYGGWYMDFHPSDGIYSEKEFCEQIPVAVYEMPLRCLYSSKVKNLFFAGRDIGTSHSAFASSRIMNTCGLSGQSAGTLVSVLHSMNKNNNDIDETIIEKTQQILRENDMFLLHKSKDAETNLATKATILTNDTIKCGFDIKDKPLMLNADTYIAISQLMANSSAIELISTVETEIEITVYNNDVPHRKAFYNEVNKKTLKLCKGINRVELKQLMNDKSVDYLTLLISKNINVEIATSKEAYIGIIMGNNKSTKLFTPYLEILSYEEYNEKNLVNGYNRPYKKSNAWISQEVPATLAFKFNDVEKVSKVELYFNPELSIDLLSSRIEVASEHHDIAFRNGVSETLVKSYDIYAKIEGEKKLLKSISNNYQRYNKIEFETVETDEITVEFKETHGIKHVEVFEIKIK